MVKFAFFRKAVGIFIFPILWMACHSEKTIADKNPLKEAVDDIVTRMYSELTSEELDTIGYSFIYDYLSPEERDVLSTKYWDFKVNVPVRVSVMRNIEQEVVPFWLAEGDFEKTDMIVENRETSYEVWQKDFDKGLVELGINGLDRHRFVYFISVGAQNKEDSLEITPIFPEKQHFETMEEGAFIYHDWDELTLTKVPEALQGDILFTTSRGRSREAHLVDAFRKTKHPSSKQPDQILLTWSDDARTTQDIQWRGDTSIEKGIIKYWEEGTSDTLIAEAEKKLMEDRLLQNDRYIHRFTAQLRDLKPGTKYVYEVVNNNQYSSSVYNFQTENEDQKAFSFFWTGDIHIAEDWGMLMKDAYKAYPETNFFITSGDLVNTGLFRDQWDILFDLSGDVFAHIPFMAAPGNHDNQEGLGAWMFQDMFSYPEDSPTPETRELTYAFEYQNALFLMIDPTQPIEEQSEWIEKQLKDSDKDWKFVTFHFAPYNVVEDYNNIVEEWIPLFDKYHVDLVFTGHWHYYMRSYPMKDSQVMKEAKDGTIYLISIGSFGKNREKADAEEKREYVAKQFSADFLYQRIRVDGNTMTYESYGKDGEKVDEFRIEK